jgi:hypothetical protein
LRIKVSFFCQWDSISKIIVGKQSEKISPVLSEKQVEWEKERPERLPLEKFAHFNRFES